MSTTNTPYNIYFAGDLFDHKHLTGNFLLAQQIEDLSKNKYKCMLPQDWEGNLHSAVEIRNRDINSVITADLVLLNFDGVDLDSGTTVEFIIAKMLNIPTVLLRTDIRNGGYLFGEDWNLMVDGFPRCTTVKYPALGLYNSLGIKGMHQIIAKSIINAFEKVKQESSCLKSYDEILYAYQHVIKMCGGELEKLATPKIVQNLVSSKIEKNIYSLANSQTQNTNFKMDNL